MSLPFMPCCSSLLLLLVIFHIPTSDGESVGFKCNNTYDGTTAANYASNSIFHTNLKILLLSLSSNVSLTKGFYNTSIGEGSDKVYGLVLCRGDISSDNCRTCTNVASADLLSGCQKRSSAIWYDYCQVQYSDTNFFDFSRTIWWFWVYSIIDMTDSEVEPFKNSRAQLMRDLVNRTAEPMRGMFATGELNYSSTKNVYGLMQCKPVISEEDCHNCLEDAVSKIPECCDSRIGGRVISEVCSLRFENSSFFGESLVGGPAPSPPLPTSSPERDNNSSRIVVILIPTIAVVIILSIIVVVFLRKKKFYSPMRMTETSNMRSSIETSTMGGSDALIQYDFETIRAATNDFWDGNKLGQGGFGSVYKGRLQGEKQIAVKRLSIDSEEGGKAFMNEVVVISKLRHKNLVQLHGWCVEGKEKLLIYEYIPNRSLNYFLFGTNSDRDKRSSLNWKNRFKIIEGITRGLIYLHEDSPSKVIHRDIKASNILLDANMVPKISDFGLAKIFEADQTRDKTNGRGGTLGYRAPEYIERGELSAKSDVFSFGVLLLEIIIGRKMTATFESDCGGDNLISYVWKAWNDENFLEIIDWSISGDCSKSEVERSIHIGLLCVQKNATLRPPMSDVLKMLTSSSPNMRRPSTPAFSISNTVEPTFQVSSQENHSDPASRTFPVGSINDVSITELEVR